MLGSNSKIVVFSLLTASLIGNYFYSLDSQQNHADLNKPATDSALFTEPNSINQPVVQSKAESSLAFKVELKTPEAKNEVSPPPAAQVPIPAGAVSLETMIANFEQEKKKASLASHESPFKPVN